MKILIAEDDFATRKLLFNLLKDFGECDLTVDGLEAVEAFMLARKEKEPYDLVCLDIMMPKVDGTSALRAIRDIEKDQKVEKPTKVIIISALDEQQIVEDSFSKGSVSYAVKPLNTEKFLQVVKKLLKV